MTLSEKSLKRVRIFVSSPGDVRAERKITEDVLSFLQAEFSSYLCIDPLFWENEVQFAHNDFQGNIEPPSQSDLFICILWSRLGTRLHPERYTRPDGSPYMSGTEFEFEDAITAFKKTRFPHLMLFKNEAEISIPENPPNEYSERISQRNALHSFFEKWTKDEIHSDVYSVGFNMYADLQEFKAKLTKFLRHYFQGLLPSEVDVQKHIAWKGSPFRGLEHFDYEHAPIFKGRAAVTGEVLLRLKQQFRVHKPFMLIGGSSGVGKSSLVRAGLLRLLLSESQEWNTSTWRYAELRPSDIRKEHNEKDFADVLARALTQTRHASLHIIDSAQTLRTPPSALPQLLDIYGTVEKLGKSIRQDIQSVAQNIKHHLSVLATQHHEEKYAKRNQRPNFIPEARLCLLLDQTEEFFTTTCCTPETINAFFKALRVLVEERALVVVATIRADFLGCCEEIEDLQFLKDGNSYYHLSPPSKLDISAIIREPAQAAGVLFEKNESTSLDEALRVDALSYDSLAQGTTVLPLLEFTLTELYEKAKQAQKEHTLKLTFAHYQEMGGLQGAIATKADVTFAAFKEDFPSQAANIFSQVMRCLVKCTQEGIFSRQRALREKMDTIVGGTQFINAFISARLLTADVENEHVVISIAHEALLHHWQYLRQWLEQEREYFAMLQRVKTAYALWKTENETKDLLLHEGKSLRDAEYLRSEHINALNADELRFIAASRKHAERQKRRLYMLIAALIVGFTLAVVMFYQARIQEQKAIAARNDAEDLITFMLYEMYQKLHPLGQLSLLEEVQKEVERYYEKQEHSNDVSIQHKQGTLLSQQGDVLKAAGKYEEALIKYQEALTIKEKLAQRDPANISLQQTLAISLDRFGDVYKVYGDSERALENYEASLAIRQALAEKKSNDALILSDVSRSLKKIGDMQKIQGNSTAALYNFEKSLQIERLLVENFPQDVNWQKSLSISLQRIGDILVVQGKFKEARPYYQENLEIERHVMSTAPENVVWQVNLAMALQKMGDIFKAQEDYEKALTYYLENLTLSHMFVKHEPNNMEWQRFLSTSLQRLGDTVAKQGKDEEALAYHQKSLHINRKLMGHDPANTTWQHAVILASRRVGGILLEQGKYALALPYFEEDLRMSRALTSAEPLVPQWQWTLAIALEIMADTLQTQNNIHAPLTLLSESIAINQTLVQTDPTNNLWRQSLASGLMKKSSILAAQGKKEEALLLREELIQVQRTLLQNMPDHGQHQYSLAKILLETGTLLREQGHSQKALQFYEESLFLLQTLTSQNPADSQIQWLLSQNHMKIFQIIAKESLKKGEPFMIKALTILQKLAQQEPTNALYTQTFTKLDAFYRKTYHKSKN